MEFWSIFGQTRDGYWHGTDRNWPGTMDTWCGLSNVEALGFRANRGKTPLPRPGYQERLIMCPQCQAKQAMQQNDSER